MGFVSCSKTKLVDVDPQLEITVVNDGEILQSGVDVKLYESQSDWNSKTNEIDQATTDSNGVVHFDGLEPIVYFFSAEKGALTNEETTVKVSKALQYNVNARLQITIK